MKLVKSFFFCFMVIVIASACFASGDFTPCIGVGMSYFAYVTVFKNLSASRKTYDPVDFTKVS